MILCDDCGKELHVGDYPFCKGDGDHGQHFRQHSTAFDGAETTVVWRNPQTGEVAYPGQNNIAMPDRYARRGFERTELRSLRQVEQFEKAHGVRNERAWFDKGSGRSFDNDGRV